VSTTGQAELYSGQVTSHACPGVGLSKRLMLPWVHEPRIEGGQEMTHGRSLERHLKYIGLVDDSGKEITISEWATLAHWGTGVTRVRNTGKINVSDRNFGSYGKIMFRFRNMFQSITVFRTAISDVSDMTEI